MISVALPALIVSRPAPGDTSPKFRDVKGACERNDARWGRKSGGHRPGPRKEMAPHVFRYLPLTSIQRFQKKKKNNPMGQINRKKVLWAGMMRPDIWPWCLLTTV